MDIAPPNHRSVTSITPARGTLRQVLADWDRRDWRLSSALLGVIALMHVVGFVVLLAFVAPHQYRLGSQVFGIGLGVTAYTLGLRHAFDADHIAAIDNTTRKLMADGKRPKSVGFWFAMGHSTMVFVLAALVVLRLQTIVSRETKPGEFAVLTVGRLSGSAVELVAGVRFELTTFGL